MRFNYVKLVGYIGIYNGLNLDEIEIDFTKCKHNVVMIVGDNGSGKSTINKALHPLPDTNDKLIKGKYCEKRLVIEDEGILYSIIIKHGVKDNGDRETTKAYIDRINPITKEVDKLNPNGNISSYKEILYDIFSLDPNYVALSQIGGDNRGIADKTPSERKKYVGPIISSIDVYNNMYKTLNKRSSIYKSMVNTINAKINEIGEYESISNILYNTESKLNNLIAIKDNIIEQISNNKSKVQVLDPDNSIREKYNNINTEYKNISNNLSNIEYRLKNIYSKINKEEMSIDDLDKLYKKLVSDKVKLNTEISFKEKEIKDLLLSREQESKKIQEKISKIQSLELECDYDLDNNIKKAKENYDNCISILKNMNISIDSNITKDEYIVGTKILKELKDSIEYFKDDMNVNTVYTAINYIRNNTVPNLIEIENRISSTRDKISKISTNIIEYKANEKNISHLDLRPHNCKIDDCKFIKEAILIRDKISKIDINKLELELMELNDSLSKLEKEKNTSILVNSDINNIRNLLKEIERYNSILYKLPIKNVYNKEVVLDILENKQSVDLDEIDILYSFINKCNAIDDIKYIKSNLDILITEKKVNDNKIYMINSIRNELSILDNSLNSINTLIERSNDELLQMNKNIVNINNIITEVDTIITITKERNSIYNKYKETELLLNSMSSSITDISTCLKNITKYENDLSKINVEIRVLSNERDSLSHSLKLLTQYNKELKEYSASYNKIETIRKYTSPNKGIQTKFMSLYMNQTISLANDLLKHLFNGEYILQEFVIDETEFRIPCTGKGLPNNDISCMSTSEICMISMIISFALLLQSSTKYNIIKLDEIDGGLDNYNRIQFFNVLDKLMDILKVEQCIMISHNKEMDLSSCDVILLKSSSNDNIDGNIIFKY